jgi:hypothetical protein
MINVNKYFLEDILSPIVGGADMDDFLYLQCIDSNDEHKMKELITEFILPYYKKATDKYKQSVKNTMMYYLTTEKIDFERIIESNLLPFDTPLKPVNLYIFIWKVLFPQENFYCFQLKNFVEKHDQYEPVRLLMK